MPLKATRVPAYGVAGTQVIFKCFPDTVDPRGPKGSR